MNEHTLPESKTGGSLSMELGYALGQCHTFGLVAGRCSAAQAYAIRGLREQKLFKECCRKWIDFCPEYLKMSRAEADRIIQNLDEFGPAFFEVAQYTRISPEAFRAIAPAVSEGALHHKGEAIPLNAENSRKVAEAIAEMRSALPKKSAVEPGDVQREVKQLSREPDIERRIHNLAERCVAILAELDRMSRDEHLGATRICVRTELARLRDEVLRVAA